MTHPEIQLEQAYLDHAHERLDAMRDAARALSAEVIGEGAGGTFANRVERDIRVELSGRRLQQLSIGDGSVCFGRLDFVDSERAYVGRVGVSDDNGDQLVVDWRAPIAEAFYRATPADPGGVARRRHFQFRGRRITGIDDELLDRATPEGLVLMGEGALIAGLERARTGRMHDIVSTIQREQDAVIRSELAGVLVVQGGPGTGKTAVALHRAAYLLFAHRVRLERDGVLLVGPNNVFLRYIEQVLPSLGEHTVALATPSELYAGKARATHFDHHDVADLKGDGRMAQFLVNAVATRERPLRSALVVGYGRHELTISAGETRHIVSLARSRPGTHNARRTFVERQLARAAVRAWREAEERSVRAGRRGAVEQEEIDRVSASMVSDLRRVPSAREALERMWPVLTPEELLHDLFGAPALLREAGRGLFSDRELALLQRERSASVAEVTWTDADMALLDEAAQLLGSTRRRARGRSARGLGGSGHGGEHDADAWMLERSLDEYLPDCPACGAQLELAGDSGDRPWRCESCGRRWATDRVLPGGDAEALTIDQIRVRMGAFQHQGGMRITDKSARVYGHVVVDEAQQITPMQWRALSRRCPSGSFTVVGDLGQASGASAPSSWEEALSNVRSRNGVRMGELTVNYRTPAEVMELAGRVLAVTAPNLTPPSSVRESGFEPIFEAVGSDPQVLVAEAARAIAEERALIGDGRIAAIVPHALRPALAALLEAPSAGDEHGLSTAAARQLLDAPVVVLALDAARGLEFDSVVLVEPGALVAEHAQGLRALYVALTRTTKRLRVVHSAGSALPPGLAAPEPRVDLQRP